MKIRIFFLAILFGLMISSLFNGYFAFADDFSKIYGSGEGAASIDDNQACEIDSNNPGCTSSGNAFDTAKNIINTALSIVGVVAVIVIIIAGVTITASAGDPGKIKKAKSAIIYAMVGLVISIASGVIVNFVLNGVFN